jgi:hypothetical protein
MDPGESRYAHGPGALSRSIRQEVTMLKQALFALVVSTLLLGAGALAHAGSGGKCNFDSDCDPGVKCHSGTCATAAGGKCNFDSDCGGKGAKCNSGKCSNAPDGKCNFDSECAGAGKCSSGKCKK